MDEFQVRLLTSNATVPARESKDAAGYDLCSAYGYVIPPGKNQLCFTDLQMSLPEGYYGRIASRSGISSVYAVEVGAGVIDNDYRGNVGVLLFNFGKSDFFIGKGMKIAQLVITKICTPPVIRCLSLGSTERGCNGFGSTG